MAKIKKEDNSTKLNESELEAIKKIRDYKLTCESNIVSILWKKADNYFTYDNLKLEFFTHNEWKVYFQIGYDIVVKEKKPCLDIITTNLYLEKHPKLKEKFEEYGGIETMQKASAYVDISNMDGYIQELNKWNTVLNLVKAKFPIAHRLKDFIDMTAEEIYDEYEAVLNHIFINVDGEDKTYDIVDGLDELLDELNEGMAVGLPLYNSPLLNEEIGGNIVGNITLIGAISGAGKSTLSRTLLLPSHIEMGEKIVIMINEEGRKKWQRELLVWVANNVFFKDLQKYVLRNGKFSDETMKVLKDSAEWIKQNKGNIILKPFQRYSTAKAIKCIKKYAHMGVKYFMLDTYKADNDTLNSEAFWFNMQQNMVKIYDTIKPDSLNVHIWITFQLSKNSSKQRCYTQENIGMAKNIIDVASTCLMVRSVLDDEYDGEKKEVKVFKTIDGSKTKKQVKLNKGNRYQIIFIIKNREGSANDYQIVVEHDMSRNIYREIGITTIAPDF